jgi:SAM-dependent methyltransferase
MKICLNCHDEIEGNIWICRACNWEPLNVNGVRHFAPHIAGTIESYDPEWYAELASLEANNFWFTARNQLIQWLAKSYLQQAETYLEVGCGTGFVLKMIGETFPDWKMHATEVQPKGIEFAKQRVSKNVTFFQMDACAIPFRQEFDVVGAFDVIEHIQEDTKAISEIYASLKPNGFFILSIPQHMFLWSKYDELSFHFRRYSAKEIEEKLKKEGFTIIKSTSFNSILLPLMLLSRYLKKTDNEKKVDIMDELRLSTFVNSILSSALKLEFLLMRMGVTWPVGGSRVVVAQKNIEQTGA